jgi:hypothetical protein
MPTNLSSRVSKLEQTDYPMAYAGAERFVWHSEADDEALRAAELQATEECKVLVVRRVVRPPARVR